MLYCKKIPWISYYYSPEVLRFFINLILTDYSYKAYGKSQIFVSRESAWTEKFTSSYLKENFLDVNWEFDYEFCVSIY